MAAKKKPDLRDEQIKAQSAQIIEQAETIKGLRKSLEEENAIVHEMAYDILEIHTELGGLYSHLRRLVNHYNIGTSDTINHGVLWDSQKGNKNNG